MKAPNLSVRELFAADLDDYVGYWTKASNEYLIGMGVDLAKFPSKEEWYESLSQQLEQDYAEKTGYCLIWELDGKAVGHSNVGNIVFGKEALMHLHLWQPLTRGKGYGTQFVEKGIPFFFKNLQLQVLRSTPYAYNPAPNKTLPKVGFKFIKKYKTIPGTFNLEQEVNLYEMTKEDFLSRYG